MKTKVKKDRATLRSSINRGRPKYVEILWYFFKIGFFTTSFPWPSRMKAYLLRLFGARVGVRLCIKPKVNIHMPWRLVVGDYVSIGEEVFILNFEKVEIGTQATISQRAFLCCGNHDFRDSGFVYKNGPIAVSEGAWIGAQTFIGPNVVVGVDTVVAAGSVVFKSLESNAVYRGNPATRSGVRWKELL